MIAASPEAICVWPHTMRQNGTTLLRSPIPRNAAQVLPSRGIRTPSTRSAARSIAAASPTRSATMVNGGSAFTAMPVKKNEPPHSTDKASSIAHSAAVIARLRFALATAASG
jgi:hypothetical protein